MKASPYAYLIIRQFEGLRLTAYRCPSGTLTIGYGHTSNVREGQTITQTQAEHLLQEDVNQVEAYLNSANLKLTQSQFDALTSLIFNIGPSAFQSSTLFNIIRLDPTSPEIATQFRRWIYSRGQILSGLQRRREAEIELYCQPD